MISIIMPVYNGERYISEAIESVLNQSYKDIELLIINDGSTDNTLEICNQYLKKDNRVRIINQENQGVSAARNIGLRLCQGEYLAFIDCDDYYTSNRIEKMYSKLRESMADIVISNYQDLRDGNFKSNKMWFDKELTLNKEEATECILTKNKLSSVCRCLMKKEIIRNLSFSQLKFAEDLFFLINCVQNCRTVTFMSESMYIYRRNEFSMTQNSRDQKYVKDYAMIPQMMYDFMIKYNYMSEAYLKHLSHEYGYASIRIRRNTSYKEFVNLMNDESFRYGMRKMRFDFKSLKTSIPAFLVQKKIYFPFVCIK